jgi:hypothetical protein
LHYAIVCIHKIAISAIHRNRSSIIEELGQIIARSSSPTKRGNMSIADLKTRLHDVPGIETLTMTMPAGRQNYNLNGRMIALDASASDFEVEQAIRASLASPAIAQMLAGTPVPPAPAIAAAPANSAPASPAAALDHISMSALEASRSAVGQSLHFDRGPIPSDLPDQRTFLSFVGMSQTCQNQK